MAGVNVQLDVSGTNFEVGRHLGCTFKSRIQQVLHELPVLENKLLPFYSSKEGCVIVEGFLETCKRVYPQYVDELRGIADGAQQDFQKLFLLHVETEVTTLLQETNPVSLEGCTDIYLNTPEVAVFAHTEDVAREKRDLFFRLSAHIEPTALNGQRAETFISFCAPGLLAGHTFALLPNGLAQSMNVVFQKEIHVGGIPRHFVNRAMASARTIDEAVDIARTSPGTASGFSMNYGQCGSGDQGTRMVNLEAFGTEDGTQTVLHEITGFDSHYNEYERASVEQVPDISSQRKRQYIADRVSKHCPSTSQEVLDIVGSTESTPYPVYRDGTPPDVWATAGVALFDFKRRAMDVFSRNPVGNQPDVSIPFY